MEKKSVRIQIYKPNQNISHTALVNLVDNILMVATRNKEEVFKRVYD